jgi:UDP-N-acetylglucosamine enolpyruvyl transferase
MKTYVVTLRNLSTGDIFTTQCSFSQLNMLVSSLVSSTKYELEQVDSLDIVYDINDLLDELGDSITSDLVYG